MPPVHRDLLPRDLVISVRQYHPAPRTGACCHVLNIKTIPMLSKSEGGMALCILTLTSGIDCDTLIMSFPPRRQRLPAALMSIALLLRKHARAEICRRGDQPTWSRCRARAFARQTRQISCYQPGKPLPRLQYGSSSLRNNYFRFVFHTGNLYQRMWLRVCASLITQVSNAVYFVQ